ncbi:type II secretion system F family protein [Vallicoccus soli]|uniref:Type II secretion system F family protein n=1 Tax=Vallicoccus soli TaxID=2339232 RepID=A0A3A3ZKZ8_9ACTN|nr:type II secretion system F family protein [Vallicoccus soli]RJK96776.1 type II secretion system F family protein [Vallicoccus soli]
MAATLTFQYAVRDRAGKVVKGTLEADSQAAVAARLRSMGYAPVSITQARSGGLNREITLPSFGAKVSLKDLAVFARQFATMVDSGLSLLRALSILEEQSRNPHLTKVLGEVRTAVQSGTSLSAALAKHPQTFPVIMINMVRAGEVGGFLDEVLLQLAQGYEADVKLMGKIKSAMTYPVVVLVMAVLAVIGMLVFIVPVFEGMFASLGGKLPPPTLALVFLSHQMAWLVPLLVVLLVAASATWVRVRHLERVRDVVDPLKLRAPVFGTLFQKIALSRFCRNFGSMLKAGVPILQALDIVAETSGNRVVGRALQDVRASVAQGQPMTAPLAQHAVFPPMVVQMLAVGEDTGAIDVMLFKIGEFYDQEVEATTESLTALMEPLIIALLGSIVGAMIVALYMPIFKIFDLVQG